VLLYTTMCDNHSQNEAYCSCCIHFHNQLLYIVTIAAITTTITVTNIMTITITIITLTTTVHYILRSYLSELYVICGCQLSAKPDPVIPKRQDSMQPVKPVLPLLGKPD